MNDTKKTNEQKDMKKAKLIFVGIVLAWLAYLLLSHDSRDPIKNGVHLYQAQMISATTAEVKEFEFVINQAVPQVDKEIRATGDFKTLIALKNSSEGKLYFIDAPSYVAYPLDAGQKKLINVLNSQGGSKASNVVVALSSSMAKTQLEGKTKAILIQMLNSKGISATVIVPYKLNHGIPEYGFLEHIGSDN